MPSESHEQEVRDLLGMSFDSADVPNYPARMYWSDGEFLTSFPNAPMQIAEVRLREAYNSENGDYTIYEARAVDTSNPTDSHGEWHRSGDADKQEEEQ